jgi:small subunit ribosomal protein S2
LVGRRGGNGFADRDRIVPTSPACPTHPRSLFVPSVSAKELIEAGVHFGHRASRWNPRMRPYIFGRRNLIHIIDVRETIRGLLRAKKYLKQVSSQGSLVLFVGTKRQASDTVQRESLRCGMPFVNDRWLGGTLTNFRTIRSRLSRLEELEKLMASDEFATYSKKMQSALKREFRKMYRNLNGIRTMNRAPDCMVIIDPKKEKNAVSEARKIGVSTVALIDTDCDPDLVDLPIPGNDDSIRSIELIVQQLADAVLEGKAEAATMGHGKAEAAGAAKDAAPVENGQSEEVSEKGELASASQEG